jgi:hypothetical protein
MAKPAEYEQAHYVALNRDPVPGFDAFLGVFGTRPPALGCDSILTDPPAASCSIPGRPVDTQLEVSVTRVRMPAR